MSLFTTHLLKVICSKPFTHSLKSGYLINFKQFHSASWIKVLSQTHIPQILSRTACCALLFLSGVFESKALLFMESNSPIFPTCVLLFVS